MVNLRALASNSQYVSMYRGQFTTTYILNHLHFLQHGATSLMETVASTIIDRFHVTRKIATVITFVLSLTVGAIVCLGYSIFYMEISLPNGSTGQILDILDYASNSVLMPIVALITCLLIGWFAKPRTVLEEVEIGLDGKPFRQRRLFVATVKFVAPVLLVIILLQAFNLFSFLG